MDLWNTETPIRDLDGAEDIHIPDWIDQDITPYHVAAIVQGGCGSGAYMPAVTYSQALDTMRECGDEVCDYISDQLGELPIPQDPTWSTMATTLLSAAVELWASSAYDDLAELDDE